MYKILLGIPAMFPPKDLVNHNGLIIDKEVDDDVDIWCYFDLCYYGNGRYQFSFETMLNFDRDNGCRDWICECFELLTGYMNEHGYDTSKELSMYEVFTEAYNANTMFPDIETAYAWLKFVVNGFNGKGL